MIKETVKEYQWKNFVDRMATLESSLHASNNDSVAEQGNQQDGQMNLTGENNPIACKTEKNTP